jgi:hypothetical protein
LGIFDGGSPAQKSLGVIFQNKKKAQWFFLSFFFFPLFSRFFTGERGALKTKKKRKGKKKKKKKKEKYKQIINQTK